MLPQLGNKARGHLGRWSRELCEVSFEARIKHQVLLGIRDGKLQQVLSIRGDNVIDIGQSVPGNLLLEFRNENLNV